MNQSVKVLLACALGAFVGTLVALQVNHNFWWVGFLVGFLVGYLSYEYKEVAVAVMIAWRETTSWRPDGAWWKAYVRALGRLWVDFTGFGSGILVVGLSYLWLADHHDLKIKFMITGIALVLWPVLATVMICFGTVVLAEESTEQLEKTSGAAFYRMWFWDIPRALYEGVTLLPAGIKVTGKFLRRVFRLIHSEVRLLCGIDAAIGAAVGYHYHNVFIGMVVGGLWGVLNFEVFSIRVLKCVPAGRSIFH
jgi:hypothetical protein